MVSHHVSTSYRVFPVSTNNLLCLPPLSHQFACFQNNRRHHRSIKHISPPPSYQRNCLHNSSLLPILYIYRHRSQKPKMFSRSQSMECSIPGISCREIRHPRPSSSSPFRQLPAEHKAHFEDRSHSPRHSTSLGYPSSPALANSFQSRHPLHHIADSTHSRSTLLNQSQLQLTHAQPTEL